MRFLGYGAVNNPSPGVGGGVAASREERAAKTAGERAPAA
jgi:hypothetical protein